MEWQNMYMQNNKPTVEQIGEYVNSPLWQELNETLAKSYHVMPQIEYSRCSMQRGWNAKYRKRGKSLCTLYPMDGYFITLIVIGEKNQMEAEFIISGCCQYVQNLFKKIPYSNGCKWLMIDIKERSILEDVEELIAIRAK